MKLYRLMGILLLLENHDKMTAQILADHFEVSIRTIYRDLEILSEAGFTLVTESGPGGGISLLDAKRPQLSAMDEAELIRIAQKFSCGPSDLLTENLALKIRSQLSPDSQKTFDLLQKSTLIDPHNWTGKLISCDDALLSIQKAIIAHRILIINYQSNTRITLERRIHPLGLCQKNNQWYFVGFCELEKEYRTFKLSNIIELNLSDEHFSPHDTFDLNTFWAESTQNYRQKIHRLPNPSLPQDYLIKIQCPESALSKLSAFTLISRRDNIYVFDMISESIAFTQLVLLDDITLIEPQSLINRFILHGQKILKKYENH